MGFILKYLLEKALRGFNKKFFLVFILAGLVISAGNKNSELEPGRMPMMFGVVFTPEVNGRELNAQIQDLKDLGVDFAKFWLDWREIEPVLAFHLSWEDFSTHPEIIDEYAFPEKPGSRFKGQLNYSRTDRLIQELNSAGISPIPLIADGAMSPGVSSSTPEQRIAPEQIGFSCQTRVAGETRTYVGIGREQYLAQVYLLSAGLARRYSHPGMMVEWWNTENELNWTYIHTSVAGWRCGKAWSDKQFLTDLLHTLYLGVKMGNPQAKATMNVNIHDPNWLNDLKLWSRDMDALGLGAYPNYLFAIPKMDWILTDAVRKAVARASGKPVFILETGYPSGPKNLGWNEKLQAEYISESISGAVKNRANAYIYFKLDDTDLKISPVNLQKVENHWGLVRLNGTRKPAFFAYQDAVKKFSQSR